MIIHYLCTTLLFVFINMQRIVLFDIAKALCIVLVVVGHYIPENSPVWYECLNKLIYSFHMPLFMFASGFIYMATKKEGESYSKFLVKKLKRLMLPYVVVSVIVISIKMPTEKHALVENPVTAYAYIKMLYFPEAGYFLWFIWALWWMFVIAPLFATKQKRLLLLGAALLLYCIPPFLPEVFCFKQFQSMLVFFMLGAVCCDWSKIATSVKIPFWAVCLSFAALEYFYIRFDACYSVIPFVGIATIIYLSDIISRGAKKINGLLTISATSYIIYLFHTTFEGAAKAALQKFAPILLDDPFFAVGAVLVISAGVAGPMVLYRYILAKYKLTQFIFGIKRQQAASDRLPAA